MTERNGRRKDVGGGPCGQTGAPYVPPGNRKRSDETAIEHAAGLEGGKGEYLCRMFAVVAEIDQEHHELRAHDSRQSAVDAEIGDVIRVQAGPAGEVSSHPQGGEKG